MRADEGVTFARSSGGATWENLQSLQVKEPLPKPIVSLPVFEGPLDLLLQLIE